MNFLFGSLEKHHGYIFFAGVIFLILLLQTLGSKEKNLVVKSSLISGLLVSFFALLEYMGISVFFHGLSGASWGSGRSISTLGNPNYVAGYLLMLLPLVRTIRKPERYVIASIFVMAILATKSFIAIFLLALYGVYLLSQMMKNRRARFVLPIVVGISFIIGGYFLLPADKLLSLTSRFILMRETFSAMVDYPASLLVGFGPDTIIHAYEGVRSTIINAYFPSGSAIDSSHNIVIDTLFQYGVIPVVLVPYFLYKNWNHISLAGKE